MGPKFVVVIKKGEHGAMFFGEYETHVLLCVPTDRVVDPTGAGDTFAGGMMGLTEQDSFDADALKTAMALRHRRRELKRRRLWQRAGCKRSRAKTSRSRMGEYRKMLSFLAC